MRIHQVLAYLICISLLSTASAEEFQSLFNGTNLNGWAGQADFWSVQDGAIVGETTKEKPAPATKNKPAVAVAARKNENKQKRTPVPFSPPRVFGREITNNS